MADWQRTHGKARGAYLAIGSDMLYVRQVVADGAASGQWQLFVNGRLEGTAEGETTARAAAELAVRCMDPAQMAVVAAAAGKLRSAT
jgi:hypothetical protein